MFANERMAIIRDMLETGGAVTTAQISRELKVSVETVRRDLLALEREHRLVRVHGGAVSCGRSVCSTPLSQRLSTNLEKKRSLSKAACRFIEENDTVTVDAGSTAMEFSKMLAATFSSLTVITHSLDVFRLLHENSSFEVLLLGGRFSEENAFFGRITENAYRQLHLGKVFIMPSALSLAEGLCAADEATASVTTVMVERADAVFVLADSDKFEKKSLYTALPMDTAYTYVSDSGLSEEMVRLYGENGYRVVNGAAV